MARNGEPAPNWAGIGHSAPTPTDKRSGLTGIVLEETDDPRPGAPAEELRYISTREGEHTVILVLVSMTGEWKPPCTQALQWMGDHK